MQRKKIVMLLMSDAYYDSRVMREASVLSDAGYSVTLIALEGSANVADDGLRGICVQRLRIATRKRLPRGRFLVLKCIEVFFRMLFAAVKAHPDVYHCHDLNTLPIGIAAALITGSRLIYDSHELHTERTGYTPFHRRLAYLAEHVCLKRVDMVFMSDGESRIGHLRTVHGLRGSPPIVDIGNFPVLTGTASAGSISERLGIPAEARIIVYVGNATEGRGVGKPIPFLAEFPELVYVIMGRISAEYRQRLCRMAVEAGALDKLIFLDPVPPNEVVKAIRGAHAGMCLIEKTGLSYYYSRPTKMFEYMAAGMPVIGSNFPEISNIILQTGCSPAGWLINPGSDEDLRRALIDVVNSPETVKEYGATACRLVRSRYNWEREGQTLCHYYEQIVQ